MNILRLFRSTPKPTTPPEDVVENAPTTRVNADPIGSTAKTLIAEGIEIAKSGDFAGAILTFDKAISLDPTDPGVYFERSKAKKEVGDEAGAKHDVAEFKLRFERLEEGLKAHDLARAAYEADDYKETIKQFNKAISLCPTLTSIFYERGLAKQCLGDYRGAEEDFTRGIQANDSTKARAFHQRGKVRQKLKNPTAALQDFSDAVALCPDDADMLYSRATVAEPYDGLQDLDRAIALRPDEPMFYFVRAIRRHAMEDIEGAINDLTTFIELKPMDESVSISEALSLRATMKAARVDHSGALVDYNMAIEADSGKATLYVERGLTRFRLRDYSGAADDFGKSIALDNTNGEAHYWRGLSKSEMGLKDEAEEDFVQAKALGYTEESA
jgi:tetratricopeptide (TPR) repeat protein